MLNVVIVAIAILLTSYLAFSKRLAGSSNWKATVTPLASIMGSGFLVSAPLLAGVVGNLALICMAMLLLLAYLVGEVIRFNIRYFEPIEDKGHGPAQNLGFLSRFVLANAYFISIVYYLQLLASFLLKAVGQPNGVAVNIITTGLLLFICGIGMWRGLGTLERVEKYAISLNLGMIGALLVGLMSYNLRLALVGTWGLPSLPVQIDFNDVRVVLGLLIVVQGFETSRYLGHEHPAEQRITTMRSAQCLSTVIYLVFIALATVLFHEGLGSDVTAIIEMVQPVALVLPLMLAIAAIGSQFSAAVADSAGAGGLIEEITGRKLPIRYAYLLILAITVTLTWETNVNQIIAYASRAFALYYTLQCGVAMTTTLQQQDLRHRLLQLGFIGVLTLICLTVFVLGIPSEQGN